MTLTHRQARRRLGSRTARRAGTNGKNIPGRPTGRKGQINFKYRHARAPRKLAWRVRKIMEQADAAARA